MCHCVREGAKNKVLAEFSALGNNTIDIYPGKNWGDPDAIKIQTLNQVDLALLRQQPYLKGATPQISVDLPLRFLNRTVNASVYGVSDAFSNSESTGCSVDVGLMLTIWQLIKRLV